MRYSPMPSAPWSMATAASPGSSMFARSFTAWPSRVHAGRAVFERSDSTKAP